MSITLVRERKAAPSPSGHPKRSVLFGHAQSDLSAGWNGTAYELGDQLRAELWREYKLHTDILKRIGMVK